MDVVYNLIMVDKELSDKDRQEALNIGFFSSYEKAETVAQTYQKEIPGFHSHDFVYHIEEKPVIGDVGERVRKSVYIIYGWNENRNGDEVDIVESDCFALKGMAEKELALIQKKLRRTRWCMDCYQVDECHWTAGVLRIE
jgi:hypothetical protein